jgi:hypothetical protein
VALPLPLRNRLAELILESLHAPAARDALAALARFCREPDAPVPAGGLPPAFPREWFEEARARLLLKGAWRRYGDELCERALRAWEALRERPLAAAEPALDDALRAAADLFDARLFFEVHEWLEPHWVRAEGPEREALQGLIQVAVGFQHLANANLEGARMLLEEGAAKLRGKRLAGRGLDGFARGVSEVLAAVAAPRGVDWAAVPRFPRGA